MGRRKDNAGLLDDSGELLYEETIHEGIARITRNALWQLMCVDMRHLSRGVELHFRERLEVRVLPVLIARSGQVEILQGSHVSSRLSGHPVVAPFLQLESERAVAAAGDTPLNQH